MKITKLFILFFLLLYLKTSIAQTTAIPDQNFEQALIDLKIDNDGVVNGKVLTTYIENIIVYDFTTTYSYNNNCNLSTNDFENLNSICFYSNPVRDKVWFDNAKFKSTKQKSIICPGN